MSFKTSECCDAPVTEDGFCCECKDNVQLKPKVYPKPKCKQCNCHMTHMFLRAKKKVDSITKPE